MKILILIATLTLLVGCVATTPTPTPSPETTFTIALPTIRTTIIKVLPTSMPTPTLGINSSTGTYKDYYLGLVDTPEGTISGSECYGEFIVLINNKGAANPSYGQLVNFLQQDKTDQFPYQHTMSIAMAYYGTAESHINLAHIQNIIDGEEQPSNPQQCGDFAERLHNNAERVGIKCAYVSIGLSGYNNRHALNAFQTTDRGLIYIDDTGVNSLGPSNCDKTVSVQLGQQYTPQSLFPESGWESTWISAGIVTNILIVWDGDWNNQNRTYLATPTPKPTPTPTSPHTPSQYITRVGDIQVQELSATLEDNVAPHGETYTIAKVRVTIINICNTSQTYTLVMLCDGDSGSSAYYNPRILESGQQITIESGLQYRPSEVIQIYINGISIGELIPTY